MTADSLWDRYAATWSLDPATRASELPACVTGDVSYCDPNGPLQGQQALSDYMAAFQDAVPGGSFAIRSVLHHHDCNLARWELRGPDGRALQTGTSFGVLAADGRIRAITGFFDGPGQEQPG
jgi:ketosteroid isomerase-like protein